jgi:hypothetical protein
MVVGVEVLDLLDKTLQVELPELVVLDYLLT